MFLLLFEFEMCIISVVDFTVNVALFRKRGTSYPDDYWRNISDTLTLAFANVLYYFMCLTSEALLIEKLSCD